jgi:hypothetical protein
MALRPWTEVVRLHPDVEAGTLTEAAFAIDLGALASGDPTMPPMYRDAEAFFRATYLTADLRKLLEEVLASLAGKQGYNRVLKLRTPFGGGKSHTLAALFHAARYRRALDVLPEARGFAEPGDVAVAVFDGEKFDARDGKRVDGGPTIQTMWGWLAWQIDPKRAFPIVEGHDRDRVAPGGDKIREVLSVGAGGRPVLILLDEVLKYMERAAAVPVLESTLQRQAKDFLQNLTVEVAGSTKAALVYSLTWSAREALGNIALLEEIDKLAARVDQLREPVAGDEILPVLQRRLLAAPPEEHAASEVAAAYADAVTGMRRAYAETPAERQQAEEEGLALRDRIRAAYPFHPDLIDLMRDRWSSLDAFQRTRGALRFLASCLHSLKRHGGARALLGPGDVPLGDPDVRVKLVKELGAQNEYDPVISSDLEGPKARAKRIDERLAAEQPPLAGARPASRLATAIFVYSFGGLRRGDGAEAETLPPGVTESELLAASVGPDLDNLTATAVLAELRNTCLYLHHDGVRYVFKKDPNVTKLIEDAEQEVSREEARAGGQGPVRAKVRGMLEERLAGHRGALLWPVDTHEVPDEEPLFLVGYLPFEFADLKGPEQEARATQIFTRYGNRPRRYRNGLALAVPERRQIEALRRAARYLLAVERVEAKRQVHRLSKEQLDQLKERRQTELSAAEAALRDLYTNVWLPRVDGGQLVLEKVEKGGRPLQATGVHERVMELLTGLGAPKVHARVTARKIMERLQLGRAPAEGESSRPGAAVREIVDSFFSVLDPPRLSSADAIQRAIAEGVAEGLLAYTQGAPPALGPDGTFQVAPERVVLGRTIGADEVDLDSGFVMVPSAVPQAPPLGEEAPPPPPGAGVEGGGPPGPTVQPGEARRLIRLAFRATRDQVFKAFPAIANLADKSDGGKVKIEVEATSDQGYDPVWLRNAVEEPLSEADVERESSD